MKTRKLLAILTTSSSLFAGAAASADLSGWYVGADFGYNNTADADWTFTSGTHPMPFEDGWAGALKVGKDLGAWRAELEYTHRKNDAEYFGPPGDIDNAAGDMQSNSLMLNGYYDFTPTGKVTPYIGVGLGGSKIEANNIRKALDPTDCCTGIVDDSDTVLAMQIMAGAAYQATPNLDLTLEYRYFLSQDPSFNFATGCYATDSIDDCGVDGKTSDDYRNHSILLGLRYRF